MYLPREIINNIFRFGIISDVLLDEIETFVCQKYWEATDNGKSWSILPVKLVQKKLKNKLLGELLTRNIFGIEVYWDNLEEPILCILDRYIFEESIKQNNIDIYELDDSIYIGGKLFYLF